MLGDAVFNFQATMARSGLNEGLTNLVNIMTNIINDSRVFAAVIGSVLGNALTILGNAVEFVVKHMKDIIYYFGLFVAMRTVMAFGEAALAALKYARAINAVSIAKKTLSIMGRRNILALLAVAGTIAFLGDEFDEFALKVGELGEKIFSDLPPELQQYFDPVFKVISDATNAAADAADFMNTEFGALGTGTTIQLSSTGVDPQAMRELQKLIDGNQSSVKKLTADYDALNAVLGTLSGQQLVAAQYALAGLKEQIKEADPLYKTLKDNVISIGQSISTSFADALVEGKNAMEGLKDVFKNFVKVMIAKAMELYVFNHIINAVFGLSGGAALPTRTFGLAGGGAIQPNRPTLVGERGPELFIPSSTGTIMNNHNASNMMGGGAPTVVNQTINVDAGVSQTVRAEMMSLLPVIRDQTVAAVADQARRGGSYSNAFR